MTRVDPVLKDYLEEKEKEDVVSIEQEALKENQQNNGGSQEIGMMSGGRYATRSSSPLKSPRGTSPLKDITGGNVKTRKARQILDSDDDNDNDNDDTNVNDSNVNDTNVEELEERNGKGGEGLLIPRKRLRKVMDDALDEEEEAGAEEDGGGRRYPRRNRRSTEIYDPYEEPRTSHRRVYKEVEEEEEEEEMEDERMKPFGRYSADHRYGTRFRNQPTYEAEEEEEGDPQIEVRRTTRVRNEVQRYSPCKKITTNNNNRGSPKFTRYRSKGNSFRSRGESSSHRYSSRRRIGGDSDDDLIQDRNDHLWGLLAEAAQQDVAHAPSTNPLNSASLLPPDLNRALNMGNNSLFNKPKTSVEITPISVDASITFNDIGGLEHYVHSLKEMVFLPLVYPEVFRKFHLNPPKGVLLHGPPGTGKTLCARALAAAAKRSGQNVSFFMRKGADVLSKWVGESERQLRLLFEEAQKKQPSIIFFDEIDGLCPVRSSKQDQIHNSIVSTLLALMDGLDNRGQVVVIGATNRIDSVDSALRRPGRFDRELSFPLPNVKARKEILNIHTKNITNLSSAEGEKESFLEDLAHDCVGYCGADLKALCTEASLQALRRHYPQIYSREEKLVIDTDKIEIRKDDFKKASKSITPASQRSGVVHAQPLPKHLERCLEGEMNRLREVTSVVFNPAEKILREKLEKPIDYHRVLKSGFSPINKNVCVCGEGADLFARGLLHDLEALPCFAIGHPDLLSFGGGGHSPEEALVKIICEARKLGPSIVYLPNWETWWATSSLLMRSTFLSLISSPSEVLFLSTSEDAPEENVFEGNVLSLRTKELDLEHKRMAFEDVFEALRSDDKNSEQKKAEVEVDLPLAPPEEQVLEGRALALKLEEEEESLRQLRIHMRNQLLKLLCEHRWRVFSEPLGEEEKKECESKGVGGTDLLQILRKIDQKEVMTTSDLAKCFGDLVATTEILYGGYAGSEDAKVVSRSHMLKDQLELWIKSIPESLQKSSEEIIARRDKESKEEERKRRATRSGRGDVEVPKEMLHVDIEAVARQLRQEAQAKKREQAQKEQEEQEKLEKEKEMQMQVDQLTSGQDDTTYVAVGEAEMDRIVRLVEQKISNSTLHQLNSLHAILKQLIWSYRMEPNRDHVAKSLIQFLDTMAAVSNEP